MLLIKNCKVMVNGEFLERNILIDDESGKIARIVVASEMASADEVLDAEGNHAIPGAIDAHVHCREPGLTNKEDFLTASRAAAAGGVTTILDMPNTKPATTTIKLLNEKRKLAAAKSIVNYGFHFGATASNLDEIRKAKNIAAVKVYMGSSTGDLLVTDEKALEGIFSAGKTIAAHAESEELIKANTEIFSEAEKSDPLEMHLRIRSNEVAEREVLRAAEMAKKNKAQLHICHVSTKEEAEIIAASKKENTKLSCEATPHHLFLSADNEMAEKLGTYAKVNPPLRLKEDVAALWQAISAGTIDMVATDHAPHLPAEKEQDYWNAPSGMPGLQTMLPLLLDAVNNGKLTLKQLIKLTSENPAAVFRIQNKGKIARGYDADITIVDLDKEKTIKNEAMLSKCGWTPFNWRKAKGAVAATIVNGKIIYRDDAIIDEKTKGMEAVFG